MISRLQGKVVGNRLGEVELMTASGVGYLIHASFSGLKKWTVGAELEILTYMSVRENAIDLFGFTSDQERNLFLQLLDVSGVGPKTALHILSLGSVDEIAGAIGRADLTYLTKVSGIGKKTAERIIVELKNKLGNGGSEDWLKGEENTPSADAIAGLVALGYSEQEARQAVHKLDRTNLSSEQLLKTALKGMAK